MITMRWTETSWEAQAASIRRDRNNPYGVYWCGDDTCNKRKIDKGGKNEENDPIRVLQVCFCVKVLWLLTGVNVPN